MEQVEPAILTKRQLKDLTVLAEFISCYCSCRHEGRSRSDIALPRSERSLKHLSVMLCEECAALLLHGVQKRIKCPLAPKPTCRKCHVHCYSGEYRAKIREIMAFSGRRMIMNGRLDYLWHYLF